VREPVHHHLELQRADGAQDGRAAVVRMKDLDGALLAELLQPGAQLLRLHRSGELDPAEHLRSEERQAAELQPLALAERVSQPEGAAVRNADDVAGVRLVHDVAALREERHDARGLHFLAAAAVHQPHAALEAP
jgi:hypothetical protein